MTDENTDWFGPDSATFGDRVAGAREASGMTQTQLARRLGIKKATLTGWENDMSEPRANKLSMLAGLLNVSIVWLLTGEGEGALGPEGSAGAGSDFGEVLAELREIRAAMRTNAERAALVEKKLRLLVQSDA
ncbi:helix-turn-helix domain-containing protein [Sedimentitalea nanhaiensis]|uniref:Helix-turn-helix n=1 Tax=Sedimentitalea nanhaiensis TaxID=999627 RepID=A0A1I6ZGP7_9RHOB|nr:helix-turn-helix transcriptional regulator [Sedimentitalea nanhaiensis]SFT61852.1 Helix-turn-helix [Sedimentitalea nanhaiensis]